MNDLPVNSPERLPRRWLLLLVILLLLVVIVAGGNFGMRQWRSLQAASDRQAAALAHLQHQRILADGRLDRLEQATGDIGQTAHQGTDSLSMLQARVGADEETLTRLNGAIEGGSGHLQLLIVERLLLEANDRIQLAGDAQAAAVALGLAQDHLGQLDDPRLLPLRKQIAEERAALKAVPTVDLQGAALSLIALGSRLPKLALRVDVPDHFGARAADPAQQVQDHSGVWAKIRAAFSSLAVLRRSDRVDQRLLSPEQAALVGEVLALRLDSARLALMHAQTPLFRADLKAVAEWLTLYYRDDDPEVRAAQAEIARLATLELAPPLPDITPSLTLLRSYQAGSATAVPVR
jgi:uroporphyrin-3 C-methyltransferase